MKTANLAYLIGVTGGPASGKTSLSMKIQEEIGVKDCLVVSTDSFYKDLEPG